MLILFTILPSIETCERDVEGTPYGRSVSAPAGAPVGTVHVVADVVCPWYTRNGEQNFVALVFFILSLKNV